ncbi:MAG: phosphoethanolamine--lipid A transferase [Rubrivivax sp.]
MLPLTPRREAPIALSAGPSPWARRLRLRLSAESLLLLACAWFAFSANRSFVLGALKGRAVGDLSAWGLGAALMAGVLLLHLLLLAPLATRWTTKPLLALLIVVSAAASFYMQQFGVYLDPTMLRNVLATHWTEASELLSPGLLVHLLLYAVLPLLVLWRVELVARGWRRALLRRVALVVLAFAALVALLFAVFQPLASLMRNHKELRYLVTPANVVWSLASVAGAQARASQAPRRPIGLDAQPGPSWASRQRPTVLVVVVGETARAANWGLSGYARATTPQLATLPVINFPHAVACGTNTETSVPCLFAPVGRRDYDEGTIRGSESLLHVLARAGVGVTWRDNQSGCKGTCEGLPAQSVLDINPAGLCAEGRCLDEGLLHGLPDMLRHASGTQLLVLHQLGNHGPSYFRRYPPNFARFQPECRSDDLHECTREQIVNAYDNALLYTDHVLAMLLRQLQAASPQVDTALLYVSDHGESLGENNLFLHGVPYAIAPDVQTRVPMLMWLSDGFAAGRGIDLACLRQRATQPAAHDHLFHTVLGLLDVRTQIYAPDWDLGAPCRREGMK